MPEWPKKRPPARWHGRPFHCLNVLSARLVYVVTDYAAKDCTGDTADNCTLDLISARHRTNYCTGAGTNGSIAFGVFYDRRPTCRG